MWARLLVVFSVAAGLWAQRDPKDLLVQMSRRAVDSISQLPPYVTTETIERKYFEPHSTRLHSCDDIAAEQKSAHGKSRLSTSDMVRADVAIVGETEMYSWLGENHYVPAVNAIQFVDDRESSQFLLDGAAIVGLSRLARIIFSDENEAVFSYAGDQMQDGRNLSEFGFNVSQARSHLKFNIAGQQIKTAYEGTFLVDTTTADLVRLVVRVADLAPSAGICELTQTVEYGRVRLEGKDLFMPEQVLTQLTKRDESWFENRATYSNCRRLPAQIAEAGSLAPGAPSISPEPALPPGIRFSIGLDQPIDTATAAFGDRIHASLTSDMVDKSGTLVFSAGATVDGRIIKLLRVYGSTESSYSLTILVRWETVRHARDLRRFTARAENTGGLVGRFSGLVPASLHEADGFPLRVTNDGLFEIRGLRPSRILHKGMASSWMTVIP